MTATRFAWFADNLDDVGQQFMSSRSMFSSLQAAVDNYRAAIIEYTNGDADDAPSLAAVESVMLSDGSASVVHYGGVIEVTFTSD